MDHAGRTTGRRRAARALLQGLAIVAAGMATAAAYHAATGADVFAPARHAADTVLLGEASKALQDGAAVFVDARPREAYEEGHIPGALSLPLLEFDEAGGSVIEGLSPAAPIITYCEGVRCDSAARLAALLLRAGYRNARAFRGGWEAWRQAGHPAETGAAP